VADGIASRLRKNAAIKPMAADNIRD